jgi:hypothetical protein
MKVAAQIPCHGEAVMLPVRPRLDRTCATCRSVWRADVSPLKQAGADALHKIEWLCVHKRCP